MSSEQEWLELLCTQLYVSTDTAERTAAEKALVEFTESPDCLRKCMLLLQAESSTYAQLVASSTLQKLICKSTSPVNLDERIELGNYILNYMVQRPKLTPFVVQSLCLLYARLTKLGWFDFQKSEDFPFRSSVDHIIKLTNESSVENCTLAVEILACLVAEMHLQTGINSIAKHRKIAASFRDLQLFDIFQASIRLLSGASTVKMDSLQSEQYTLLENVLKLSQNCLNFDFIGSITDDTSDDNFSLQIPTAWRPVFLESSILELFFGLYDRLPNALTALALSCLVQLASVRRTIFNNQERQAYLVQLSTGVKHILDNPGALQHQPSYHEFCRLIARLKSNYQLSELLKVDDYPKIIQMLTDFTVASLRMYQLTMNSIHYLLSFWMRVISSMPYVKNNESHYLDLYAPMVTKAYIESRLSLVESVARDGIEDPLDDHASVSQQLEQISVIGRCDYQKTCQLLMELFDRSGGEFEACLAANDASKMGIPEARLTWLVHIIGAAIGGRLSFNSSDDHDEVDGDLICRVMKLIELTDNRLPAYGCEKLELAYLWFLEQFRKIYISDSVQKVSKVYAKLGENLGLRDESSVLAVFARKIITNLKYWTNAEKLIDDTLNLLNDLSVGYSSVRKLVRLNEIQFLMRNHTNEHFSFLGTQCPLKTMKCRTTFYSALTRLLCIEISENDSEEYEQFLAPLVNATAQLTKFFSYADATAINQEEAKKAVIGLARDLRGVAFSSCSRYAFSYLFNWMYPNVITIFQKSIELWYIDPDLTTPVLKLMAEFCQDRSQRLNFDIMSPSAYLLFKEASKMMCNYGSRILAVGDISRDRLYRMRLKGTMICFNILKVALNSNHVNFGVFRLYGDSALDDALSIFVKLLLSVPQTELLAYQKLSQHYYFLMETLAQYHMPFMSNLEPSVFVFVMHTLQEGLTALDTSICTGCCTTLDHVVTYVYKRVCTAQAGKTPKEHPANPPEGDNILKAFNLHSDVFRQLLTTIIQVLMFDECRNQWSMSRPLLGLILLNEEYFNQLKLNIIRSIPADKQEAVNQCFNKLMEEIERNLSVRNKDKFTQNLTAFRREVTECLRGGAGGPNNNATSSSSQQVGVKMFV